jgi:hypothetical protein
MEIKKYREWLFEQVAPTSVEVKVDFEFIANYPTGSTDPSQFVAAFTKGLIDKINATPNGAQMLKSGEMTIVDGWVNAGASNTWGGKATSFDTTNNYDEVKPKTPTDPGYIKNTELAKARALAFWPALTAALKSQGISEAVSSQIGYYTGIIDTGGVSDSARDKTKYPNAGQIIFVELNFKYKKDIPGEKPVTPKVPTETTDVQDYREIKANMVLDGSYYCNGFNGAGQRRADEPELINSPCSGLPFQLRDGKHMSAFEIKWNPNVFNNPFTEPITRWIFTWGSDGKIANVMRYQYNKQFIAQIKDVPQREVEVDDAELKYFMGLRDNQTETGGRWYAQFIAPFI